MSSSVYIPSTSGGGNTSPASISVKTASYTIPAGKYARVIPNRADFTINGSFLSTSSTCSVNVAGAVGVPASSSYQIDFTTGSLITSYSITNSSANYSTGGLYFGNSTYTPIVSLTRTTNGTGTSGAVTVPIPAVSTTLNCYSAAFTNVTFSLTYRSFQNSIADIWISSGTVLGGSSYVVEEYTV